MNPNPTVRQWWKAQAGHHGVLQALRLLLSAVWQFLRESTPQRRRQRYGDIDFDWDHRVDTTGATVGRRTRFLGTLHSRYQPTDPALFHEMMQQLKIQFPLFTFIDLGSGKGRVLLMAADYPFRRIIGVELLPDLHQVAAENIRRYKADTQCCFALESICGDAVQLDFPPEPTVLYLFNPLLELGTAHVLSNLECSLREHPRAFYVVYHNPLLESVFLAGGRFRKAGGNSQYSIYEFC